MKLFNVKYQYKTLDGNKFEHISKVLEVDKVQARKTFLTNIAKNSYITGVKVLGVSVNKNEYDLTNSLAMDYKHKKNKLVVYSRQKKKFIVVKVSAKKKDLTK